MNLQRRPYGKQDGDALRRMSFEFGGKIWVYDSSTETKITFKVAENRGNDSKAFFAHWFKEYGKSRKEIAKQLKISQSYLSKIENGKRKPPQALIDLVLRDHEERREAAKQRLLDHVNEKLK